MAYKYPKGAKSSATIVVDVIGTVSWVDFLLDIKLPHILFPIDFSKTPTENGELYKKYEKFHKDVVQKMSYRQKVDMFFALADVTNITIGEKTIKTKTLFLALGDFRNQIAHNPVMTLVKSKRGLTEDSVGYKVFYEQYDTFHKTYKLLEPMLKDLEKSLH
jgi:hypothetical protein